MQGDEHSIAYVFLGPQTPTQPDPFHSYTSVSLIISMCAGLPFETLFIKALRRRRENLRAVPLYGVGQMGFLFLSKPPVYEYSAWKLTLLMIPLDGVGTDQ